MKKVAVLQSNYIPWKGYFDIIHDVDLFIFHDDLQYTKGDWRNRNKIVTPEGLKWLTIPVGTSEDRQIVQVEIPENDWQKKHWLTIERSYSKAPYFSRFRDFFFDVYMNRRWKYLYELDRYLITEISKKYLGINTEFADSRDYATSGAKQEKLLSLLKSAGAEYYLSGPAAKDYIKEDDFASSGIQLAWKDYSGYTEYKQQSPVFEHGVSIIDLLFNTGDKAPFYIWGTRT
jgi:hypothetical protein